MLRFQKLLRIENAMKEDLSAAERKDRMLRITGLFACMKASVLCDGKRQDGENRLGMVQAGGHLCLRAILSPEAAQKIRIKEGESPMVPVSLLDLVTLIPEQKQLEGLLLVSEEGDFFLESRDLQMIPALMGEDLPVEKKPDFSKVMVCSAEHPWIPQNCCVLWNSYEEVTEYEKTRIRYMYEMMEGRGSFVLIKDSTVYPDAGKETVKELDALYAGAQDAICMTLGENKDFLSYRMEDGSRGIKDHSGIWSFGDLTEDPQKIRENMLLACEENCCRALVINDLTRTPAPEE